jgi:hypothetical protein
MRRGDHSQYLVRERPADAQMDKGRQATIILQAETRPVAK